MAGKRRTVAPGPKPVTITAVHPSAAIEAAYQRKLVAIVDELHASVSYWVQAAYKQNAPEMAQDESPASFLQRVMARLARRWQRRIDDMAPKLAAWFATAAKDRAEGSFKAALREGGFTVAFKMTAPVNDVFQATLQEQVGLIKTIPQQYLAKVQGAVMRSVQTGRDIGGLAKELEEHYGVTKRRAQFIATSQNNIATSTIMRARQQELGITEAVWLHSRAGRHPRPEHVAMSGKTYDTAKGAFLQGVWTWPGREPNCRCVSKSILPSAIKSK